MFRAGIKVRPNSGGGHCAALCFQDIGKAINELENPSEISTPADLGAIRRLAADNVSENTICIIVACFLEAYQG